MRDADGVAYTHVIDLRPDKGGRFGETEIHARFASAEVVLVSPLVDPVIVGQPARQPAVVA